MGHPQTETQQLIMNETGIKIRHTKACFIQLFFEFL
jgi:hypothetical protein